MDSFDSDTACIDDCGCSVEYGKECGMATDVISAWVLSGIGVKIVGVTFGSSVSAFSVTCKNSGR